ncbi:MAG: trigger factor [Actinomycetes bacterium]
MKSDVETVDPTTVKLSVEVPFDELTPSVDSAYQRIAGQVQIPGFRKGKVPPRIIDQRFGRGVVLEEAINDALPRFYGDAVREHTLVVLGQPEVDVTEFNDGGDLKFTAQVNVRPTLELPDYKGLEVTVDTAEVDDAAVDEQLQSLRERFGTLSGAARPAADGDFVQIDLVATVDGEEVDSANGVSYQIGSGSMIEGLDEAVTGLSAGESASFETTLAGGEHEGRQATVSVTVAGVKERELPELDDEFAQLASEFDTLDELRADVRERLGRVRVNEQALKARDAVLEKLLELVEVPVPEAVVAREVEQHLADEGRPGDEEHGAEVGDNLRRALRQQFLLDHIADAEEMGVTQEELTDYLIQAAMQQGMSPDDFAQRVMQAGQVPLVVSDVRRGKALAFVVEQAVVTDTSGNPVDLSAIFGDDEDGTDGADVTDADVNDGTDGAGEAVEGSDAAAGEVAETSEETDSSNE